MTDWFASVSPVAQAALAATGTWLVTGLGALPVLWFRSVPRRVLDVLMGFAGGVMTAAACWSLLTPALALGGVGPAAAGVAAGVALIYTLDQVLPHLHSEFPDEARPEGPPVAWRRSALLFAAITLHNLPEGLAIGVAYGGGAVGAATALAIGIGLQNLPEGLAIALPLRRDSMSRWKAWWYGQLSAVVEPVAAFVGAVVVLQVQTILPYALALAAGAMLYVVVEELIPETVRAGHADSASLGFMLGFVTMMVLDNAFA